MDCGLIRSRVITSTLMAHDGCTIQWDTVYYADDSDAEPSGCSKT